LVRRKARKRLVQVGSPRPALTAANQEWALDFVRDAVASGRAVEDEYTRECPALEVDTSIASGRVTRVRRLTEGHDVTSRHNCNAQVVSQALAKRQSLRRNRLLRKNQQFWSGVRKLDSAVRSWQVRLNEAVKHFSKEEQYALKILKAKGGSALPFKLPRPPVSNDSK
jgi:hypothetical protein